MPLPTLPPCSVLVLAGGAGQRMGQRDKGLIEWRGRPLIAHLHALVRPLSDDLIISCNRNHQRYAHYADHVVSDAEDGYPGPLAGLISALATTRHDHLLVLPCDTPLLDTALLTALRELSAQDPQRPVMVRAGKHWQPLISVFPLSLAADLRQAWEVGDRSPKAFYLAHQPLALDCDEHDPRLANLNTPALLVDHSN